MIFYGQCFLKIATGKEREKERERKECEKARVRFVLEMTDSQVARSFANSVFRRKPTSVEATEVSAKRKILEKEKKAKRNEKNSGRRRSPGNTERITWFMIKAGSTK